MVVQREVVDKVGITITKFLLKKTSDLFLFAILSDRNQCVKYDGVPTKSGSYDTPPPPLKGTDITGGMYVQHL